MFLMFWVMRISVTLKLVATKCTKVVKVGVLSAYSFCIVLGGHRNFVLDQVVVKYFIPTLHMSLYGLKLHL